MHITIYFSIREPSRFQWKTTHNFLGRRDISRGESGDDSASAQHLEIPFLFSAKSGGIYPQLQLFRILLLCAGSSKIRCMGLKVRSLKIKAGVEGVLNPYQKGYVLNFPWSFLAFQFHSMSSRGSDRSRSFVSEHRWRSAVLFSRFCLKVIFRVQIGLLQSSGESWPYKCTQIIWLDSPVQWYSSLRANVNLCNTKVKTEGIENEGDFQVRWSIHKRRDLEICHRTKLLILVMDGIDIAVQSANSKIDGNMCSSLTVVSYRL